MKYELTVEERLTFENLKLKRQLVDSETRALMAAILRKHAVPAEAIISFTDTHLLIMGTPSSEGKDNGK
jgi:hypothetical protein